MGAARSQPKASPHTRLKLSLLLLVLLGFGIWTFLNVKSYEISSTGGDCGHTEQEHTNSVEQWVYGTVLPHIHPANTGQVVVVSLTEANMPLHYFTSTCDARRLFSFLIPHIAEFSPKVIVIDKFYSVGACPETTINDSFRQAMNRVSLSVPLVVGQQTEDAGKSSKDRNGNCLAYEKGFDFNHASEESPAQSTGNIQSGLTRLNENTLQVPLAWVVEGESGKPAKAEPGLALVAARQAKSAFVENPYLTKAANEKPQAHHPFALFARELPTLKAMDVLCSGTGKTLVQQNKLGSCDGTTEISSALTDKVVLIGEQVDADKQPFPGGEQYGLDLQAQYTDALMSGHVLRELPYALDWAEVGLFAATFGLLDLFGEYLFKHWSWYRNASYKRLGEALVLAAGLAVLVLLALLDGVLLFRGIYTPVFVLALKPIGIYLILRLGWLLLNTFRDLGYTEQGTT